MLTTAISSDGIWIIPWKYGGEFCSAKMSRELQLVYLTDYFGTYTFVLKDKWTGDKYVGECQKSLILAASNLNALAMRKRP